MYRILKNNEVLKRPVFGIAWCEMWRRRLRWRAAQGGRGVCAGSGGAAPSVHRVATDARAPRAKSRRHEATTEAARFYAAADKIDIELKKNTKNTHCSHEMNVPGVECEIFL